jgi:hypothetical protein
MKSQLFIGYMFVSTGGSEFIIVNSEIPILLPAFMGRYIRVRNLQNLWFCRSSYQVLVIRYQVKPYATSGLAQ